MLNIAFSKLSILYIPNPVLACLLSGNAVFIASFVGPFPQGELVHSTGSLGPCTGFSRRSAGRHSDDWGGNVAVLGEYILCTYGRFRQARNQDYSKGSQWYGISHYCPISSVVVLYSLLPSRGSMFHWGFLERSFTHTFEIKMEQFHYFSSGNPGDRVARETRLILCWHVPISNYNRYGMVWYAVFILCKEIVRDSPF